MAKVDGTSDAHIALCREKLLLPKADLNPEPLVVGTDLIALQIPSGPQFAELLRVAREAQLDGIVQSKDETLDLIRKHVSRK